MIGKGRCAFIPEDGVMEDEGGKECQGNQANGKDAKRKRKEKRRKKE